VENESSRVVLVREAGEAQRGRFALERIDLGVVSRAASVSASRRGGPVLVLTENGEVWAHRLSGREQGGGWTRVEALREIVQIAGGSHHSAALRGDGTVWTWGANTSGELGDGTLLSRETPAPVEGLREVVQIASGEDFNLALTRNGTVYAWGANWREIAPGTRDRMLTRPVEVAGLRDINRIAVAADECFAQDVYGRRSTWCGSKPPVSGWVERESPLESSAARVIVGSVFPWKTASWGVAAARVTEHAIELWQEQHADSGAPVLLERFATRGPALAFDAGWAMAWIEAIPLPVAATGSGSQAESDPELGPPPTAPLPGRFKQRLNEGEPPAEGGWIDTSSRTEVQSLYNLTYRPALTVPMNWTGSVITGDPGVTSQAYKDAVATIINWYRGMAGVPTGVTLDPVFSAKDQQAALMFAANNALSHSPPSNWKWYTAEGAEAAANSNICLWSSGMPPGCVDSYIRDDGSNNTAVGHRRWILYPQTKKMGTGDVSSTVNNPSSNALWVFDGNYGKPRPATRDPFVAWPSKGYFPYNLVPARWSFSYPGASFSSAGVTVVRNGVNLPATLLPVANGYGENTLVWTLSGWDSSPPSTDSVVTVTVSNVSVGGVPQDFTYQVIVFNATVTYSFTPNSASVGAAGGTGTTQLQVTPASAAWTISSSAPWLSVTSAVSGAGNATVSYSVAQNPASSSRSATLNAGNAAFTVTQAGAPANNPPSVQSVSPNTGAFAISATHSFQSVFVDPDGASTLSTVRLRLNVSNSAANGCDLTFTPGSNQLALADNAGTGGSAAAIGSAQILSNSQCSVLLSGSSATAIGNSLTLAVPVQFTASFTGAKTIFARAQDAVGGDSGWQTMGSLEVVTPPPTPASQVGAYAGGTWILDKNGNFAWDGTTTDRLLYWSLGRAGEIFVVGDWNGDGKDEIGLYVDGAWQLDYNGNGIWDAGVDKLIYFGGPGYKPYVGDWNGDGKDDVGAYLNGTWILDWNGNFTWDGTVTDRLIYWSLARPGEIPILGDWNGDGKTKLGLYVDGTIQLDYNGNGIWEPGTDKLVYYGGPGYTPYVGDWDGNGTDNVGAYQNGTWILDWNGNFAWDGTVTDRLIYWSLGRAGEIPILGDWNGNGQTKLGLYVDGTIQVDYDGNAVWNASLDKLAYFGGPGQQPVIGRW
jgi:hypothetical protein